MQGNTWIYTHPWPLGMGLKVRYWNCADVSRHTWQAFVMILKMNYVLDKWDLCFVIDMFLSNNPSSGDINSTNLSCWTYLGLGVPGWGHSISKWIRTCQKDPRLLTLLGTTWALYIQKFDENIYHPSLKAITDQFFGLIRVPICIVKSIPMTFFSLFHSVSV